MGNDETLSYGDMPLGIGATAKIPEKPGGYTDMPDSLGEYPLQGVAGRVNMSLVKAAGRRKLHEVAGGYVTTLKGILDPESLSQFESLYQRSFAARHDDRLTEQVLGEFTELLGKLKIKETEV